MIVAFCPLLVFLFSAFPAQAGDDVDNTSHLPIPRFASLRSDEVNMRTGPGMRYPIAWVYKRKGLPVEITAEYDIWRRVRDPEGIEGWISKVELSGKRGALIKAAADLREKADDASAVRAHLEPGALGQILSCTPEWCRVKFDEAKGYVKKTAFWGAYSSDQFD
jgi:SH3-like domain-containing protein